jgi:PIN domain nuclease of toxin-antitoxin system
MKFLIDTQAIIWWLSADKKLSPAAAAAIANAGNSAVVSAASIWEASIKRAKGQLDGPSLKSAVAQAGFRILPINEHHGELAGELPLIHRDPFDRMLIAQAIVEQLILITSDDMIPRYTVQTLW